MADRAHWEDVYTRTATDEVSWFQPEATRSRALVGGCAAERDAAIIDVGGGASVLVDDLLADGYTHLSVLDLAGSALAAARERLGERAGQVEWIEADVLEYPFAEDAFDVWHDRAVFHFLTDAADRRRYVAQLQRALRPGGHVVIATFAEDGPSQCSGLDVQRHTERSLQEALGPAFELRDSRYEIHHTPAGKEQAFLYCVFRQA